MARTPAGEAGSAEVGEGDDFVPVPLATDLPPGTVVGEYTIDCKLGDGGMATVYGATHPLIAKKAAIKVMQPALSVDAGLVERFILEARAVNEIGHPNIVDVFSFGRLADGRSYFVMEWLQGETLYDRIWERKPTLDEALDIMDQICDALEAAHDKGIVHRDLKPANVFLCPVKGRRELVKLLDFGVAKLTRETYEGHAPMSAPQTMSGQVVGTPDYIAPEQARGKKIDGKVDVYALGVIAYEMILGRRPFEADNVADVLRMHLGDEPPPPRSLWPEIPSVLDELMRRMLAKEANKRPGPAEVRAAIREIRGTPPPFEWDGTPPPSARPPVAMPAPTPSALLPALPRLPSESQVRRRGTRLRLAGVALFVFGVALFGALLWKAAPSTNLGPSLSSNRTAVSPPRTVPSVPATPPAGHAELPAPSAPPVSEEGTVVVRVDATDARIELDGEMIAQSASGARVRTEPGEHALLVTAPGRHPVAERITVGRGAVVDVPVRLHHEAPPPHARPATTQAVAAPAAAAKEKRVDPDYLVDPFSGTK